MKNFVVSKRAGLHIDEIYQTTFRRWGLKQATKYTEVLFEHFKKIATRQVLLRPIPAELGVNGFLSHYEKHFVYSKILKSGKVGIVTVLHQRMHQIERFNEDFDQNSGI